AGAAMEPCNNVPPGTQRQVCLRSTLLDSDSRLNEVYQQQMLRGDDATRRALREAQRRWLGHRDYICKVETGIANREAWLAHVLHHAARAQCVIQETLARTVELESASASAAPEPQPALVEEVKPAVEGTTYQVQSQRAHGSGKYYFEVIVEHGNINRF